MIHNKIAKEISFLIAKELLSGSRTNIIDSLDKSFKIADLNSIFQELLSWKTSLKNIGIDLPVSFGDYIENENITMVVALDPKRNNKSNELHNAKNPIEISVGSVFNLHSDVGKNTRKNSYWDFVSFVSKTSFVYVTDIYKIYYETKDKSGQIISSNKDNDFVGKGNLAYAQNVSILKMEMGIVKPNRIITLGRDAKNAVINILELPVMTDEILFQHQDKEFVFLPHISTTVTQSIKTIGDLYLGLGLITGKGEIESLGRGLLMHRKIEDILK